MKACRIFLRQGLDYIIVESFRLSIGVFLSSILSEAYLAYLFIYLYR